MATLTAERLRMYLNYNPHTGIFTWIAHPRRAYKGREAGTVNTATGYIQLCLENKTYRAARLAWLYMTGSLPEDSYSIDHIDNDRTNNSWHNLRLATKEQQGCNQRRRATNTSGIKGVSFNTKKGKWLAALVYEGQYYHGGFHYTKDEAAIAIQKLRDSVHKQFANHGEQL
jgi:hypothetical protein